MSSDSSDDDLFRRRRPALKRQGPGGAIKHMNLSKYGKGIELTKNKQTKGDVWGDSSSDEGYASASGSDSDSSPPSSPKGASGGGSDSEERKSEKEESDSENKSKPAAKKEISKDAFSAMPVGGLGADGLGGETEWLEAEQTDPLADTREKSRLDNVLNKKDKEYEEDIVKENDKQEKERKRVAKEIYKKIKKTFPDATAAEREKKFNEAMTRLEARETETPELIERRNQLLSSKVHSALHRAPIEERRALIEQLKEMPENLRERVLADKVWGDFKTNNITLENTKAHEEYLKHVDHFNREKAWAGFEVNDIDELTLAQLRDLDQYVHGARNQRELGEEEADKRLNDLFNGPYNDRQSTLFFNSQKLKDGHDIKLDPENKERLLTEPELGLFNENARKHFDGRSVKSKLIHDSKAMKEFALEFNEAKKMMNVPWRDVMEKVQAYKPILKNELKEIYKNKLHDKNLDESTAKMVWDRFLDAGMRNLDDLAEEWYTTYNTHKVDVPWLDSGSEYDTDEEVKPFTPKRTRSKTTHPQHDLSPFMKQRIEQYTPPGSKQPSRSSTQRSVHAPLEETKEEETQKSSSESENDSESQYDSADDGGVEALEATETIQDLINESKVYVNSRGRDITNTDKIRILLQLERIVESKYKDGEKVPNFTVLKSGRIRKGSGYPHSKFIQLSRIKDKIKALREAK